MLYYYSATAAYEDLVQILQHEEFKSDDIVPNVRRLRKWRNRLPLSKIHSHEITIATKNTPSTAVPAKSAYTMSLRETIERVLSNPRLSSQMYFGCGIETEERKELWHGEIWKESPLFGKEHLEIDGGCPFIVI